jgi:hypothetical protein
MCKKTKAREFSRFKWIIFELKRLENKKVVDQIFGIIFLLKKDQEINISKDRG